MNIEIIFENNEFIVVNKPAGISVHNDDKAGNLIENLEKQTGHKALHPVHRLDRETSGIMILAKEINASRELHQIFADRSITKKYVGVTRGSISKDSGTWSKPLSDKSEGRKSPQGKKADQKECLTDWSVLQSNKYLTLAEFTIHTGRQHQIRKHAVLSKHQLIGDKRYGDSKYNKMIASKYKFDRMALHAYKTSFNYKDKHFEFAIDIPKEFLEMFK